MTEKALQATVLRKLRYEIGGVWVNKSPSPWDKVGVCDIIGCVSGRFVAIELKRPGLDPKKHLTPAQQSFLYSVGAAGGVAITASSWEHVYDALQTHGLIWHISMGAKGSPLPAEQAA